MVLSKEVKEAGYGLLGDIGGLKKTHYWTPDGRDFWKIPCMRGFRLKGQPEEGVRDANLDRGWLLTPPTELKPYCENCDEWHDTQEEIDACGAKSKAFLDKWNKRTQKEHKNNGDVESLRSEVAELKEMLQKALEVKVG